MAETYNITIEQGATFTLNIVWKDSNDTAIDLTGYSARMQVRQRVTSETAALSLTSASGITLGGAAGTITVVATATQTAAIDFRSGVYDLELEDAGGVVTRLLEGCVTIDPEVTR